VERKAALRYAFPVALPLHAQRGMIMTNGRGFGGTVVAGVGLSALLVTGCAAVDRDAAVAANNLAWMYAEDDERLDEALQLAQAAKARLPNEPEIANTLGYVYFRKGMFGPAVTALKEAVDKRPDAAAFRYHLGFAYAKNGDNGLARKTLELALKLDSNAREAAEARAVLAELATLGS